VLPRLHVLPAYTAVIECDPLVLNTMPANVAFPLLSAIVCKTVAPSFNVTEPVGVALPGASVATVTLNTMGIPTGDGFGKAVNIVAVAALLTVCVRATEVLVL